MASHPLRTSLRRKIFLRLTSVVGLALVATGSLSVLTTRSLIRQRATEDLVFLVAERSSAIEEHLSRNRSLTRLLASDSEIIKFLATQARNPSFIRSVLLRQKDALPAIEDILVIGTNGKVLAASDSRSEGMDISSLEHFHRGKGGTYIGSLDILHTRRTYAISTPVRKEDGALAGILILEFPVSDLYKLLSGEKKVGRTGEYLLLEPQEHGGVCINPRHSVLSSKGLIENALEGKSGDYLLPNDPSELCALAVSNAYGIVRAKDSEGRTVLAAYHELKDVGLGIIAKVDEQEVFAPMQLLLAILIGTTCILFLLVILIAFRLSREIVLPIWKLREDLQRLNAGHFTHHQNVFTGDELEVLDDEVGRLAIRLNEAYSSLERRVQECTEELQAGHAKDEALLESIGEGFLAIDMHGTILATNRAAETMLTWNRSEIINHHFESILHLKGRGGKPIPPNEHIIQRALTEKMTMNTSPTETFLCERRDGTSFPISMSATPFLLGMEMQGIVVTIRDITEEKRIDRMKSEFISLASHQLRTPLTAIGWYIELLQTEEETLSTDQKEYVAQILESHRRMVELVNSLLNVSRIELGHVKIDPKDLTIAELLRVPIENLTPQITQRKLHLTERIPTISVSVDPDLVRMVLENILSNAVKYTPAKGTIELSVIASKDELQFSIQDTGLGIPRAQQGRIFEKLFRAENVLKADTEGSGIGLYIAKSTVEAWGGRLWFKSAEGKGTSFSFTVPRRMEPAGDGNGNENGNSSPTGDRGVDSSS